MCAEVLTQPFQIGVLGSSPFSDRRVFLDVPVDQIRYRLSLGLYDAGGTDLE
jgi:hypothetical protein